MLKENIILGFIVLTIMVVIGVILVPQPTIAEEIDNKFALKSQDRDILIYQSSYSLNRTINDIKRLRRPYDQRTDQTGKSILLYEDYVVVVRPNQETTEIEVMGHRRAYNRHHNTVIHYWGNTLRNGSIGNPPVRGGGFGFGK